MGFLFIFCVFSFVFLCFCVFTFSHLFSLLVTPKKKEKKRKKHKKNTKQNTKRFFYKLERFVFLFGAIKCQARNPGNGEEKMDWI